MDNDSKRIGLYIGKDLLKACDNAISRTNVTSRSEFISNAIEFYIAWLNSKSVSKVLTPAHLNLSSVQKYLIQRTGLQEFCSNRV